MTVEIKRIPRAKLTLWAKQNGLTIKVEERDQPPVTKIERWRFFAWIGNVDVMENGMLCSSHGNGNTPAEAIRNYAKRISCCRLAIDAGTPKRREVGPIIFY